MMNFKQYKPTTLKAEIEIKFDHDPYDVQTIELDIEKNDEYTICLLYTSPSPRDS